MGKTNISNSTEAPVVNSNITSILGSYRATLQGNKRVFLNLNISKINNLAITIAVKVLLKADKKAMNNMLNLSVNELDISKERTMMIKREIKKIDKRLQQAFSKEIISTRTDKTLMINIAETKAVKTLKAIGEISKECATNISLPLMATNLLYAWFIEDEGFNKNKSNYSYFTAFHNYFNIMEVYNWTSSISFVDDQDIAIKSIGLIKGDLSDFELERASIKERRQW